MTKWKKKKPRSHEGTDFDDYTAQRFANFVYNEREQISKSLARNAVGFVGQNPPMPVHKISRRLQNYEVEYCDREWVKSADASFALFYERDTAAFRPAIDLGVFRPENNTLLKSQYYLGSSGLLLAQEYMTPNEGAQAFAELMHREPYERTSSSHTRPVFNGAPELLVGPEELDALIGVLHTKTKSKSHNRVYEIPGHVRKLQELPSPTVIC